MIVDRIDEVARILDSGLWTQAWSFLRGLTADVAEGRQVLQGDGLYAIVESYETKDPASGLPEAHRVYADIQMLLTGREVIGWWPLSEMVANDPYDPERDIEFFARPEHVGTQVALRPGLCAVFMPGDAHMPGLWVDNGSEPVKKVVVKVRI